MLCRRKSYLFINLLTILFIFVLPSYATAQASLTIHNTVGTVGDTIALVIELSGAADAAGIEFHLAYQSQYLSYVQTSSAVLNEMTVGGSNGNINIIWEDIFNPIDASDPIDIAMIELEILPSPPDSAEIIFADAEIVDDTGEPYALITNDGWILFNQTTDVFDKNQNNLPEDYILKANFPNPFNSSTVISFGLPRTSQVSLSVYNILGQKISTIVERQLGAGYHSYIWDGEKAASGVYFYQLKAGEYSATRKMILLK
jgi:hypothetical protein